MDELIDRLIAQALRIQELETELDSTKDELHQVSMYRNSLEKRLLDEDKRSDIEVTPELLKQVAERGYFPEQRDITPDTADGFFDCRRMTTA